jgi:hypothetical protein
VRHQIQVADAAVAVYVVAVEFFFLSMPPNPGYRCCSIRSCCRSFTIIIIIIMIIIIIVRDQIQVADAAVAAYVVAVEVF